MGMEAKGRQRLRTTDPDVMLTQSINILTLSPVGPHSRKGWHDPLDSWWILEGLQTVLAFSLP